MIKAVVFDLDHTLFDRYATFTKIFNECDLSNMPFCDGVTREQALEAFIYTDRHFIHNLKPWHAMFEQLVKQGILRDDVISIDDFYYTCLVPHFKKISVPFDFTIPTLRKLREMGFKLGLITNGKHDLQYAKIANVGLTDEFDEIVVSGDVGAQKPSTVPYEIMAQRLNIAPNEMLYVGDNPKNDVEASRKAGYIPVWVRTTGTWIFPEIKKPELQVDTVAELPELIKGLI